MAYQHLCSTVDQWTPQCGIKWRIVNVAALKFSGMGKY